MTTTVPTTQSVSDPEYNQILQVFDCLEDDVPLEIQNIQHTVTIFKGIPAREKRSKLLEVLVGDISDPVLALALACTSRSNLYHTHVLFPAGDEAFRHTFQADLEHAFPTTAAQFANSLARKAIGKMDSIYAALPASNFTRTLLEHRGAVLQVASVFETLKGINFNSPISPAVDNSENPIVGFRKESQKQAKRARARGPSIDEYPFRRMGVSRPRSQSECNKITEELLVRQKEIFQVGLI